MRAEVKQFLRWYDQNARDLPWRVPPAQSKVGVLPDPYHVWLSEVMLQQTTVATVGRYFAEFTQRWPQIEALAAAQDQDVMGAWAGLGYYARARNMIKCARIVSQEYAGKFPEDETLLRKLPGIGPYTAAAIMAFAFGKRAVVVDGNIERVFSRLFAVQTPLPDAKPELTALVDAFTPSQRAGDFAQGLMDLGATVCTPKSPACERCPWQKSCAAYEADQAALFPKKRPKPPKPTKYGTAYVLRRDDGALLLELRPEKGLLGGMHGWPTTPWEVERPKDAPPVQARWRASKQKVEHSFTHFHLILDVACAQVDQTAVPSCGSFIPVSQFNPRYLATLMRKVYAVAEDVLNCTKT